MKTGFNIKVNVQVSWTFKKGNVEKLDHKALRNGTGRQEPRHFSISQKLPMSLLSFSPSS